MKRNSSGVIEKMSRETATTDSQQDNKNKMHEKNIEVLHSKIDSLSDEQHETEQEIERLNWEIQE